MLSLLMLWIFIHCCCAWYKSLLKHVLDFLLSSIEKHITNSVLFKVGKYAGLGVLENEWNKKKEPTSNTLIVVSTHNMNKIRYIATSPLFPKEFSLNSIHNVIKRGLCRRGNAVDLRLCCFFTISPAIHFFLLHRCCTSPQVHSHWKHNTHNEYMMRSVLYDGEFITLSNINLAKKTYEWTSLNLSQPLLTLDFFWSI